MKLKKYYTSAISIFLLLILLLSGCSRTTLPTNANAAFSNFTLNLFQQDVASTTLGLHYTLQHPEEYGIQNPPVTFGTFQPDSVSTRAALENCQAALQKFPYNSLSKENQLTYDILSSYINTAIEGIPFTLYEEPLAPVTGIQAQLPVLLAEYPFSSEQDIETYLELLATAPDYFSSLISFERQKSKAGLFMADYTVDAILKQCNSFLAMGDENYLLSTFAERISRLNDLSPDKKDTYLTRNQTVVTTAVLPAYQQLVSALTALKGTGTNPDGLCNLPDGKKYYAWLVSRDTGSSRSIDAIDKLIQGQIASDLTDLQTVLSANPALTQKTTAAIEPSPSDIIRHLQMQISDTFPKSADVTTRVKYVPKTLEPYLSPAFYMIPSIDNTSENIIYINQAHTMESLTLFTTLAHEGYPGHLYQTTYYAATHPNPIRSLLNFSGYVEGWATYAEMCSYYLSGLDKPTATVLQKNNSILLGLYSAADIGIHYKNWDFAKTLQFFSSYGITDTNAVRSIYELIIASPANYLKYYVGYLEILELKKEYIKREKGNFSQKQFHKFLLDIGPAPFDVIWGVIKTFLPRPKSTSALPPFITFSLPATHLPRFRQKSPPVLRQVYILSSALLPP